MMTHRAPLTPESHDRAGELFSRALGMPEHERARIVADAPGYSAEERAEAADLLRFADGAQVLSSSSLKAGVVDAALRAATDDDPARRTGSVIGPYTLGPVLGVGGMGAVYRAVDERTGGAVALKVLREHALTRSGIARLEREARVLARMHHPHIARVLEAGSGGADGSGAVGAYFAMELLPDAVPITRWVTERGLGFRAVLALMGGVCDAVHHGHQRGVIHRDIKPQNVLVLPDGTPKLIDFGVAFATDIDISRFTASTGVGSLIGTFGYMSPEQCSGDSSLVDTRSDVYALGVLLFELLTGRRPHETEGMPLAEVIGAIRAGRVPRLRALRPDLPGDLDTITHKAMDPDPDQRYASAADLSQDITRFLSDRAIEARPPGAWRSLQLLWRRQRLVVGTAGLAAACLVLGGSAAIAFGVRAHAEERRAVQALNHEASARARAERVTAFLQGAIGSANPYQPRSVTPALLHSKADPWAEWVQCPWDFAGVDGRKATVEDILRAAAARAPRDFADEPLAMADVCEMLGVTLYRHDRMDEAWDALSKCVRAREEVLGPKNEATLRAMLRLAQVTESRSGEDAKAIYTKVRGLCAEVYGPLDARSLRAERMLANVTTNSGGDGGGLLLARVPAPSPQDNPLPPEQLVHVALASLLLHTQGDGRCGPIAAEVARRLDAGEADTDVYCRVVALQEVLTVLQRTAPEDPVVERLVAGMTRDASATFGEWSPEYMNCVGSVEGSTLANGSSVHASRFFARASVAQLRLRGKDHWETSKALVSARMAMAGLRPDGVGVLDAAADIEAMTDEFPQGLSTPGVLSACLLAEGESSEGKHAAALARLDALRARMQAPQAVPLSPHAIARLHTLRGTVLEALGRRDDAVAAYQAAALIGDQFQDSGDAVWWTQTARDRLSILNP